MTGPWLTTTSSRTSTIATTTIRSRSLWRWKTLLLLVVLVVLVSTKVNEVCSKSINTNNSLRRRTAETTQQQRENPYWKIPGVSEDRADAPNSNGVSSSNNPYWAIPSSTLIANAAEHSPDPKEYAFVQDCLRLLETHAVNGKVNSYNYVNFLEDVSKGSLKAGEFKDLPLFLSMIFFSASCSQGEDCVNGEPAISIGATNTNTGSSTTVNVNRIPNHRQQPAERDVFMNTVICQQLNRYPFLELRLPFQFLLRVSNEELSASEIMVVNDTHKIVPTLESALDVALIQGFNCSYRPGEPYYQKRKTVEHRKRKSLTSGRDRQPQPQHDCDFVVESTVADAADYPCGFQDNCILIFSDVQVYAVLKDSLDEPSLRSITTNVLREAINGNTLKNFLR